ncbi:ribosomal protection-like ABC-F family protein [uncultured Alistipes sp.]|uniref:ribosomal protection-like ABC-F family protein n=1 Tax=uncultured Alistipes sp. TaxID=538949 RepID=UPI0025E0908F|nr:ABC-F family ATP-binding cassette domain-containing protein [uncultured Alistipes sp.]
MISLDNLTVSFGGWTLFDNISFLINPKDRIGLVGKNGAGKTTLLRLITGEQQPTSGGVAMNGECTIGYLPQTMRVADTTTLVEETAKAFEEVLRLEAEIAALTREIEERTDYESAGYEQLLHRLNDAQDHYHILGGDTRDADIEKTLLGLGFRREDFDRSTSEFSGGWRMRIELAKLLLRRPSIFLLDEPTNHLDIESIQWLEDYLKNYNGAVLLISHDRAFLDNVTNRTVELSLGKVTDYKVSYSKYVVLRAERRAQQVAAYENQQRMIEKTEEFIEKFRYKPTKSNQVQSRIKQLDKLDRLEIEEEDLSKLNIKFPPAPRSGQIVAEISEVGMSFGAKHVFSGADFIIEKGDKIALVGRNGEGKTTLARMLIGQLTPTEGAIRLGANVNIGYYAQNQDDLMDGEFTVYDTLDHVAVGDIRTRLRDILGAFLFRGEDIDKRVKVLSGGERARLAMARMMLEPRNLLVLDEPTNHMDMRSKDILKDAIMKYDGTVVVVSHDREFLDGMVDKIYEFRNGGVREYLGGIYYFLEKRKLESLQEIERRDAPEKNTGEKPAAVKQATVKSAAAKADAVTPVPAAPVASQLSSHAAVTQEPASGKVTYEQRKEQEKQIRRLRKAVETVESALADIEKQIAAFDAKFAAATEYNDADYKAYNDLKASYEHQMHEWEKASYELEIVEEQSNL